VTDDDHADGDADGLAAADCDGSDSVSVPDRDANPDADGNGDADTDTDGDPDADADAGGDRREASDSRVRRLDGRTVERIAAGEVVRRPVDVVRELVENALDAGAGRVEVTVEGDETDLIRVRDDGHGLSERDARVAVAHHATSKLDPGGDLRRVATLGFRGEALASIAAVSHLAVVTNDGGPRGVRVTVGRDGSVEAPTVEPAGRARGTTVTVRDLFHNRPARRKSLASAKAEFARISELLTRYALCRPDVAVRLVHDGNETLSTPGTGPEAFVDAALAVYDRSTAARSSTFDHEATLPTGRARGDDDPGERGPADEPNAEGRTGSGHGTVDVGGAGPADGDGPDGEGWPAGPAPPGTVRVDGLLCYPEVTRSSRESIHVAVNGRPLTDATLRAAVVDGYGSLLPGGRYPVAVVRVWLPPSFVDANVHPAKEEVAYRDETAVADAVATAVEEALSTADLRRTGEVAMDLDASLAPLAGESAFADATVIGQFRGLYLLCEADDDLLVVDQHAAHERVTFERLRAAVDGSARAPTRDPGGVRPIDDDAGPGRARGRDPDDEDRGLPVRTLDPPETLSLSPAEAALVDAHAETLERLGFGLEAFGGRTYRLTAVPAPLGRTLDPDGLRETLAALDESGDGGTTGDASPRDPAAVREDMLRDLACHPSLKAGDDLSTDEATALVRRLGQCDRPYACPHGRPTVLSIEERTLAKGFERGETRFD
jgi:DNA mismatch repair protein MutL